MWRTSSQKTGGLGVAAELRGGFGDGGLAARERRCSRSPS